MKGEWYAIYFDHILVFKESMGFFSNNNQRFCRENPVTIYHLLSDD